jgi:hypothetical protein
MNSYDKTTPESVIQSDLILETARQFANDLTVWRNNTGAAFDKEGRMIRFGVKGQADVSGIMKPLGTRIEIEVKRPGGKPRPEQKLFEQMIKDHGGVYLLCDGDIYEQVIRPLKERLERDRKIVR